MSGLVIDGFAGPGGWSVAMQRLGLAEVGIELDAAACATRAAAGHLTIRADISAFPLEQLAGKVTGAVFSPVCTTFSAAGKRAGNAVTDVLESAILDAFEGSRTRAPHRREMAAVLRRAWWPSPKLTRAERSAAIWKAVRSASLVVEPARYIRACRPEWVALEQVPSVLPLWQVYADELGSMGYSTWAGVINAADYGVAQVRERAVLMASRTRMVKRPTATHYDPRRGMQLFGQPWVSMASALGWGMTDRPYFTLATAGGRRGGPDEQVGGSGARKALYAERDAGRWVFERPATTVQGDPRIGRPGHKGRESGGESQFAVGAVRVTVAEAAALQAFPAGYPWRGSRTIQHQQIGNAFPPLAAIAVIGEAAGIDWEPVAEKYALETRLLSPGQAVA